MLTDFHTRKCLSCGHTFAHAFGGFIPIMTAKCPECGSIFTIRLILRK